jgi:glycerol-3-phosphate dehydrogenase
VVGFERAGRCIAAVRVQPLAGGPELRIEAAQVVNAAGAWAREVALLAGAAIAMTYSKGTLLVTHTRLASRVVNRLRRPGNGDIMMPGGTVSIVGTTSMQVDTLEDIRATTAEADLIIAESAPMLPVLASARFIRAYAGVRPLLGSAGADSRTVSRSFALFEHEEQGLDNFATLTGGKLTTCRLMAERAADLVCRRLGVTRPCLTASTLLPQAAENAWTEPGHSAREWLRPHPAQDALLCECEMVSGSAVDAIYAALRAAGDKPPFVACAPRPTSIKQATSRRSRAWPRWLIFSASAGAVSNPSCGVSNWRKPSWPKRCTVACSAKSCIRRRCWPMWRARSDREL